MLASSKALESLADLQLHFCSCENALLKQLLVCNAY